MWVCHSSVMARTTVQSLSRTIKTTQETWLTQHGRHANETELAAELKIDLGELRRRTGELDRANLISLNAPTGDEQDGEKGEHENPGSF